MKKLITAVSVVALFGLACPMAVSAEEEEHEATLNASDVPAAVQKAVEAEAKGGKIRWEKEGANYEGVFKKKGKEIGVEVDANGKILSRHNESKEHKEKGDKDGD